MGIHVNIGEAKARLSELIAAAVRGEEIVLDRAGTPQVRLTPVAEASAADKLRIKEKRQAAFGMLKHVQNDWDINPDSIRAERDYNDWRREAHELDL